MPPVVRVPRVVLDTNVLVSALITPRGSSARLLIELRTGAFELVTSALLLAELREVLARPKFRVYVSDAEASAFVELIRRESSVVADPEPGTSGELPVDPDDRFLVDLASVARVHALVSGDARLLELSPIVPIMTPAEFLGSLKD